MSRTETELAISKLPPHELSKLSEWFEEFRAEQWDRAIERDLSSGKLDDVLARVDKDIEAGEFKAL